MTKLEKSNKSERHVISILVDNEFGALARVVSLFSARGYNIETLAVAVSDLEKNISRITITTFGTEEVIDLILKLLHRLVAVYEAVDLTRSGSYIERECALIKIKLNAANKKRVLDMISQEPAQIISQTSEYIFVTITESFSGVKNFIAALEDEELLEISRTGYAALPLEKK